MVTDLQQALREAVDEAPGADLDLTSIIVAGARRVRRRRVRRAAAAAVAVITAVAVGWTSIGREPHADRVSPARPGPLKVATTLDPDSARPLAPEVLATTRVLHLDPANQLDEDRYDGLTADGQVVRARYTAKGDVSQFGLLDPATGRTDWLPRPPWDVGDPRPLDFAADRLLYLDNRTAWADAVLTFDRTTRAWSRADITKPPGTDRFFGMQAVLGPDETVYLLNPTVPAPGQWWSVSAARGGMPTAVKGAVGVAIAWRGHELASVDRAGRVVVTTDGRTRVVATARPRGCEQPSRADYSVPAIGYSGERLVVTYACRGDQSEVVVFGPDGRPQMELDRVGAVVAIGTRWVLLSDTSGHASSGAPVGRLMALDLDAGRLLVIGPPLHDQTAAVVGDLVLWGAVGPSDSSSVYDVVYRVARLD